jgi:hypothetical protein
MMKKQTLAIADVYVPVRRRQTLDPSKACIGWKPARLSARRRSPPTSFRLVSIDPQKALRSNSSGSPIMAYRSLWHLLCVCCQKTAIEPESLVLPG